MSASSIGPCSSSRLEGHQPAPASSTERCTSALKFLHLYQGFIDSNRALSPNLRVMVLGLGSQDLPARGGKILQSCPQAAEMSYFMQGPGQILDLVDKDPELLERIRAGDNYYDPIPASKFFETNACTVPGKKPFKGTFMEPCKGKAKDVRDLINMIILGQKKIQTSVPERRYLSWDPQSTSLLPAGMNDTYEVIVATASALFPSYTATAEKGSRAWDNLLRMLKNHGLLYMDARSFRMMRKHPNILASFEKALDSRFVSKKLPPIAEVRKGAEICFEPRKRDNGKMEKHHMMHIHTQPNGTYAMGVVETYSIYVIERIIEKMEELKELYPSPNKLCYLHYLAKNTFKAGSYQGEKLLENVGRVKEGYLYASEHHGWTPLHVAVLSNNREAIRFFLSEHFSRAEMGKPDEYDTSPEEYAHMYQPHLYQEFFS